MDEIQRETLDQIYAGARSAGVDISGILSDVEVISDEFSAADRISVTVHLDDLGTPTGMAGGPSVRIEVFKDGFDWRADLTHGDTHVSNTGASPFDVARDALAPLVGDGGRLLGAVAGTPATKGNEAPEPRSNLDDLAPDIAVYGMGTESQRVPRPDARTEDDDSDAGSESDELQPHFSFYGRHERVETPESLETPSGWEKLDERAQVERTTPDPGDDDEKMTTRRVERVEPEPAFADRPEERRIEDDDRSPIGRLLKLGVPLVLAIILIFFGISLFGDDAPEPVVDPPTGEEETSNEPEEPVDESPADEQENQQQEPQDQAADDDTDSVEEPAEETPEPIPTPITQLLLGSYGGSLEFTPILPGAGYEANYLLSVLSQDSVGAVFPSESRLLAEAIMGVRREGLGDDAVLLGIILSQEQPSGVSQNTYGVISDLGDGTARIDTANQAEDYAEGYSLVVTPCEGFPASCQTIDVMGVSFGGAPDLDLLLAVSEAEAMTDPDFTPAQSYGWIHRGEATFTREAGTGS